MKKFFGVLFLIISQAMTGIGIAALMNAEMRSQRMGRVFEDVSDSYRRETEMLQTIGCGLLLGSVIFFITAVIMLVTKTSLQRRKEMELDALKKVQAMNLHSTVPHNTVPPHTHEDDIYSQLEKLSRLKEKGAITEEEFQRQKNKILL